MGKKECNIQRERERLSENAGYTIISFSRGTYLNFVEGDISRPVVATREWGQRRFHFDNVAKAMLTLFTVSTFEGWPS